MKDSGNRKISKKSDMLQPKLSFTKCSKKSSKQVQLCSDIINLVAEDTIKKSIVESDSFKALILHLDSSVTVPSRKTLDKNINDALKKSNEETIDMMSRAIDFF